jgi:CDGSH-type Zn-finger protein/uncharacterized Fe-S cluster protein YjdI
MADRVYNYESSEIRVTYDVNRCIHAAECVRGLPSVFNPTRRPWVELNVASADDISRVVVRCPTGALTFVRLDGSSEEAAPDEASVVVSENGPLFLRGRCRIVSAGGVENHEVYRVALCRCGASECKPLCDGRHEKTKFEDAGAVDARGSDVPPAESNLLSISPQPNGPVLVRGSFRLADGTGRDLGYFKKAAFCRCGESATKPFCDGTHSRAGFTAD